MQAPTILYIPANAEQLLSMSLGHPDNLAWSGPGAGSIMDMARTFCINMFYQHFIKPRYFVQPQYTEYTHHSIFSGRQFHKLYSKVLLFNVNIFSLNSLEELRGRIFSFHIVRRKVEYYTKLKMEGIVKYNNLQD